MKYKFNVVDRIIIPNIVPRESTTVEQTAIREMNNQIELSSDEYEGFGIIEIPDPERPGRKMFDPESINLKKNPKLKEEKEVDLNKTQKQILKESATKVEDTKKVNQFNLDTITKLKAL